MRNGFNAVPAWRHADVDESEGVGPALGLGSLETRESFLSLKGGVDFEHNAARGHLAKQNCFVISQQGIDPVRKQNLLQVTVDGFIVIHDEQPKIGGFFRAHGVLRSFMIVVVPLIGSSRIKVAPRLGPSLSALKDPPSWRAVSAPKCKPKPCPSFLVVKP